MVDGYEDVYRSLTGIDEQPVHEALSRAGFPLLDADEVEGLR
jgi:hypothetical protein